MKAGLQHNHVLVVEDEIMAESDHLLQLQVVDYTVTH